MNPRPENPDLGFQFCRESQIKLLAKVIAAFDEGGYAVVELL
jgi:hypothetical protein